MEKKIIIFICGILLKTFLLIGQEKHSKKDLIQMMSEGRYEEAYPDLENQYLKFPKDPDYIYYAGMCRVLVSQKIPEAIQLLSEATKLNSRKESWFYLGKAYMLNYQFKEAEDALSRFSDKATRDEKERVQLSVNMDMCRNAQDICSRSKKLNVLRIDTVDESNLLSFLNKQKINGRIERVGEPSMFSSKVHEGIKFSGNNIMFQSKVPFGKKYKDIFIAQNEDIDLVKLKSMGGIVNSPYEEEFVFYDATAPAIYFSSQGHNSAGGFDIYKSFYDKITHRWSSPVNLGFPVNTPFDEVAYVMIPGTTKSLLASKRYASFGKVVVYTLQNAEETPEEAILSANATEIGKLKPGKQNFASNPKSISPKGKPLINASNEAPPEILNEQTYQRLIHEALNLQIRSDSIKRLSDEKKELLVSTKYESDKTKLWQEIKTLDARAEDIQQKADILYKKARELEAEKQVNSPQVNTKELAKKSFSNKNGVNANGNDAAKKSTTTSPAQTDAEVHDIKYRIQVGVFSKPPPENVFKGFNNIYKEDLKNGIAFKYYVGLYKKVSEAEKGLIKVKDAGFKDAYIIGFYNGKVVPLSRARELELSL